MNKPYNKRFLLGRLLLHDVSFSQLLIYALGVFIGLFIIIIAFQFYRDLNSTETDKEDLFSTSDFIVLSKKVDGLNFSNEATDIREDLKLIKKQPWVTKAAAFTSADFNITASIDLQGRGMSTALFFESVPDDFFDELPEGWAFDPSDSTAVLPIILPRDYLALYNFGFAASHGLPKMGEDLFKTIPLTISISGNGRQKYLRGRVAGFSSRLNTIAVPMDFIDWGNKNFGKNEEAAESRIIAEINVAPSDPQVKNFIEENELEIGGDKGLADSSNTLILIIASVIVIIGVIIASLSIGLLFISIFLLLHKTRKIIYRLLALGYQPGKISLIYTGLFAWVNAVVLVLAIGGLLIMESRFSGLLKEAGYEASASVIPSCALALGIAVFITLLCYAVFKRAISKT